jgi:hypothetical protein
MRRFWTHLPENLGSDGEVTGADREVLRAHADDTVPNAEVFGAEGG